MFEFAYPWVLALLLLLLLPVGYYLLFRRPRPTVRVSSDAVFAAVGRRRPADWFVHLPLLLALALLLLALARPRFGDERVVVRAEGIDIVLVIDLSGSMAAVDPPPEIRTLRALGEAVESGKVKNRLEVAKDELRKFINGRPNDRVGLIGFAEMPYNFAPATLDHGWLLAILARFEPGMIGDRTGIAAPLASAVVRLKDSPAPRRVAVLFTDGSNNVEDRITPEQTAELAKESGVIIHTVGIGSSNAYAQVEFFGRKQWQPVRDTFDEEMLKSIAGNSGGQYFRARDAAGLKRVMDEINQLESTSFEQPKHVEYREWGPRLAVLALGLAVLAFALAHTWKLKLP